ncbi:hypothetical protein AB0I60_37185 [Actinosynnema sp. NPDC050436]|uniref:hypothetical protein n=1 Tax=Actinosynnema sp. NPDC050436 TaxID=3155659 RepID=UPI0033D6D430
MSTVHTASLRGPTGQVSALTATAADGPPEILPTGGNGRGRRELRDRVHAALANSGWPNGNRRIEVHLVDRSRTGVGSVPVLGPQDLSPDDPARTMTEESGRPVRNERQSPDELRTAMLGYGLDPAFVEGMVGMRTRVWDAGVERPPPAVRGPWHRLPAVVRPDPRARRPRRPGRSRQPLN